MVFKKNKVTWNSENIELLTLCYKEALQCEQVTKSAVLTKCCELFRKRSAHASVSLNTVKNQISILRKQFPENFAYTHRQTERAESISSSQSSVASKLSDASQTSMLTTRTYKKWTSAENRRLWELASSAFREEQLRQMTDYYAGKVGNPSGLFRILRDMFVKDQEIEENISVEAVKNQFKRSIEKFGEIVSNPMLTAKEVEEAIIDNQLQHCFEAETEFAKKPVFDNCCAICSCLLWGDVGGGHNFAIDAECSPAIVTRHYRSSDLLPFSIPRPDGLKWFVCRNCKNTKKGERIPDVFNFYDPITNASKRPEALFPNSKELSLNIKQQLSLVRFSYCVTKRSIPKAHSYHINKGFVKAKRKPTPLYYHMYGFVSNNLKLIQEKDKLSSDEFQTIQSGLLWLKKHNPHFKEFMANIETIYRYFITKKVDFYNIPFAKYASGKDIDLGEESDVLHVLASSSMPELADDEESYVGAQHARKSAKHLDDLTGVKYFDPEKENKAYPYLYPWGKGGYNSKYHIKRAEFVKNRLLNLDPRWRRDRHFMYYHINEQGLAIYYHTKRHNVASNKNRDSNITAKDIVKGERDEDFKVGIPMKQNIPGTQEFWQSKLYDLMAIVSKKAKERPEKPYPDLFVTITMNDGWVEVQTLVQHGLKAKPNVPENPYERDVLTRRLPAVHMPVEVAVAAQKRLLFIMNKVRSQKLFGEIEEYVIRAEYQNRGAIHWHILFWIRQGTLPSNTVSAELPRGSDEQSLQLRKLVQQYQIHNCLAARCKKNTKVCKYGFPFQINRSVELDRSGKRFLYVRSNNEDSRVVPYNAALLILAQAHVNVQYCTRKEMYSYLMQYQMKFNSKKIQVAADNAPDKYMRMRDVSIMEAAHQAMQFPSVQSTMEVVYLPTDFDPRNKVLKSHFEIQKLYRNNPDSEEVFGKTKLEHYMARPMELSSVSYTKYFEQYKFDYTNNKEKGYADKLNPKRRIVKRKKEAATRYYLKSILKNLQDYCLQQLILHIPFRCYDDLFSYENSTKDPLYEVLTTHKNNTNINLGNRDKFGVHYLEQAKAKMFSFENLQQIGEELVANGYLNSEIFKSWLESLTEEMVDRREWMEGNPFNAPDEVQKIKPTATDIERTRKKLIVKQKLIYEMIETWCKNQNRFQEPPFRWLISGGAGVGKTTLIQAIVELLEFSGITCQVLATTGVASKVVHGTTVHHFFKFDTHCKCQIDASGIEARMIRSTEVIIIDEVSMMSSSVFHAVNNHLQRYVNENLKVERSLFGGRSIILVGDPAQLPTIKSSGIWAETLFYDHFQVYNLTQITRTKDTEFMEILNKVRLGVVDNDVDFFLETRALSEEFVQPENFVNNTDAVYIVPKRKIRDHFNASVISYLANEQSKNIHEFPAQDVEDNYPMAPERVAKLLKYSNTMLPDLLRVVVGAKVILLKNLDPLNGWVNGTQAIVRSCLWDEIVIEDLIKKGSFLTVKRYAEDISIPGVPKKCERIQYPLDLAYSLTMHKTQGLTLSKVIVNLEHTWESGQAYVAISRCSIPENLYIVNYDKEKIWLSKYFAAVLEWIEAVDQLGENKDFYRPVPFPYEFLKGDHGTFKEIKHLYDKKSESDIESDDSATEKNNVVDTDSDTIIVSDYCDEELDFEINLCSPTKKARMSKDFKIPREKPRSYEEPSIVAAVPKIPIRDVTVKMQQARQNPNETFGKIEGLCIKFLEVVKNTVNKAAPVDESLVFHLMELYNEPNTHMLQEWTFRLLYRGEIVRQSPQQIDHKNTRAMNNVNSCFGNHFTVQNTPANGDCFYNAISQALFGDNRYHRIIRVSCICAFLRHLNFLRGMIGHDEQYIRDFVLVLAIETEWANDNCYIVAALALGRPLHVFSVDNLEVEHFIKQMNEHDFQDYCNNERQREPPWHLYSFIYSSPWLDESNNMLSQREPIRLTHNRYHFVNLVPRDTPTFDLRCSHEHYSGKLNEEHNEVERHFVQSIDNIPY